ncbi:tetratricopeptide repeat protein [Waterburya agarophytonicola K14]|uniref:Tetratricopeptide repeat protein n=1 Tax=Waterburya agarophytonicola KI4 TaxID=2874699 RepID=A0A964BMJ7_9CYAN|nr:tetratricopeptide repeat protein [Waterburya agarophytonicola]MCC0175432.1 tetratricopeptide repeat protein [Waterburya agarophytonicola KI4]
MKKTVLIHHHIFKNAGTSFNYALKQHFGEQFFEYDLPDSQVVDSNDLAGFIASHPQAAAISSHHACFPTPQAEDYQTISSIILRKPLARIKSIYSFERKQNAQTQGAIKAKELDFKDYVQWRIKATPAVLCNYQTHYCSRDKKNAAVKLNQETLKKAVNNLKKCTVVGTVENFEDTLKIARLKLNQFFPDIDLKYSRLNTAEKPSIPQDERQNLIDVLGDAIVSELEENNQLDEHLYRVASQIMRDNLLSLKSLQKDASDYLNTGKQLESEGFITEAVSCYEKAIALNPDSPWAYHNLGDIFLRQNRLDLAAQYYQKAIAIEDCLPWAYNALGDIYKRKNQLDKALAYYQKAVKLKPDIKQNLVGLQKVK